MLALALTALLLSAGAEAAPRTSGFAGHGLGLELNGAVALEVASGGLEGRGALIVPKWELGLRLRVGQFFSIGAAGEYLHAIVGGAGDDWDYERKQIAADVQWRFWGYEGILRPWVGLGMAWGSIHAFHLDEALPDVDSHVWEYLRCSAGLDVVLGDHFAIGPWFRFGLASTHDIDPGSSTLATYVLGLRVSTAIP
jgi:hypothetical protein